jgi:hypothetical protein
VGFLPHPHAQAQAAGAANRDREGAPAICFERTGGFAGVSERFSIYADGRVVNEKGREQKIPPETVERFRHRFEALRSPKGNQPRRSQCRDCYQYRITVSVDSGVETFVLEDPLQDRVDALSKVSKELCDLLLNLSRK